MPAADDQRSVPLRRISAPGNPRLLIVLALIGGALGALALFVAFGLPGYVAPPSDAPVASAPPAASIAVPPAPPSVAQPVADPNRLEAERLSGDALRRVARLEGEGARIWGGVVVEDTSLPAAEEVLARANAAFDQQKFADALPQFREAIASLDRLAASKPARFRLAMAKGEAAMAAHDAATAIREFEMAAALEPGDAAAAALLGRARKLPEVLAGMARGAQAETMGDLRAAAESYRAAAALDPELAPARAAADRVGALVAAQAYRAAVSDVLARLGEGNLRAASAALDRARAVNPNGPELPDLRQRIEAAGRVAALERLRSQAAELERQEKWSDAVKAYEQALAIDRQAAFAQSGRARARQLAELHAALETYIAEPARLQSAEPRAHASSLLARAGGGDGPALAAKRQLLAQLIQAAQTPVVVTLSSDRSTEVTVQRVGSLGRFDTRRLDLPPGRYVAIGSRAGYRDVRVPFEVTAGGAAAPVIVQCTEPIR